MVQRTVTSLRSGFDATFLSHPAGSVRHMKESIEAADEIRRFIERFGLAMSPDFEGPEAECPVCRGTIDQLALTLDLTGVDALACRDCGVVLVA